MINDLSFSLHNSFPDETILCLLDLSSAFDTIDHKILLNRLEHRFGFTQNTLAWFSSYLEHRYQSVVINAATSPTKLLSTGVPQGSVLGPILFTLYMSPLGDLIREKGCLYTCYADDTQLYINVKKGNGDARTRLEDCIDSIRTWMASNRLKLNEKKTELLHLQSRFKKTDNQQTAMTIGNDTVTFSKSVKNLGFMFDETMKMDAQISHMSKASYAVIRKISHLRKYLDGPTTEKLVHAFLTSRLDYCNSLLFGIPDNLLQHVQRFQNTAARIVTKTRKYDHITPIFQSLHWLPVRQRISFKILVTTFKIVHGLAPAYLKDTVTIKKHSRSLRSSDSISLVQPRFNTQSYGGRSFSYSAALLWNKLSPDLRACENYTTFKSRVKTLLFKEAFAK